MKKLFLFLLLFMPFFISAAEIKNIEVQTSRMSPEVLKKHFALKEGDIFDKATYEKAKQDLQELPFFKTLDFLYKEKKDGVDIHIKAEDKVYLLPMFFAFSSTKRSGGISLLSGNLFKQGEEASVSLDISEDGFYAKSGVSFAKNSFLLSYSHLDFDQRFYKNGWISTPGIFTAADKNSNALLLRQVRTKHRVLYFTFTQKISSLWSFALTPEYEYYNYNSSVLDSGNHSHFSFALQYANGVSPEIDMQALTEIHRRDKERLLKVLPHIKTGQTVNLSYTLGGSWFGSDYDIKKLSLSGAYLLEFKKHHRLAFFAKTEYAFKAPFSDKIKSSDLLFGLGIYDREQIGKSGFSAGTSFTYFLVNNQTGVLSFMPFYEQAYVKSEGNSFISHGGIGALLSYCLWKIPFPLSINYTKNLNDKSHHLGFKIGGHF